MCGEFMNGNPIFSLKPKPPLPFLNPGAVLERVSIFYRKIFLGWKRLWEAFEGPPCLTHLARGAGKVAAAIQPAQASP